MKIPFNAHAPAFDAQAIQDTIQRALSAAGLDTSSGPMHGVTETIRRALSTAGLPAGAAPRNPSSAPCGDILDVVARTLDADAGSDAAAGTRPAAGSAQDTPRAGALHEYSNPAGRRAYQVHVPARAPAASRPLVVMLHGCTQSAADFALGTRMNQLADAHDFLVVYPEQAAQANPSRCWNWFKPQDQVRDGGEPSLIAGIVREVAARHDADPRRIYVAGLSAGAAMAVALGEAYPELFAGVGVHSGLPYASAHDIPSALAAMKGGRSGLPGLKAAAGGRPKRAAIAVPTIVFHGDRDHTVQHSNGDEIVRQAQAAYQAQAGDRALTVSTQGGQSPGGRTYSRTVHADAGGLAHIERWTLHGAGHAWSGGDSRGSFTDGAGPDASAEMVRFFLALPPGGSA